MSKPQRDPTETGWGSEREGGRVSRSWSESNRVGGVPGPPTMWCDMMQYNARDELEGGREEV